MIFKQAQQVLDRSKRQTRRPVKPGDVGRGFRWKDGKWLEITHVRSAKGQLKWMVGDGGFPRTYAVQPGRGKKSIGRIRITKIRRERLRDIIWEDVKAEGVDISDLVSRGRNRDIDAGHRFELLWRSIYRKPNRWEDNPEVWVLEFERVKE